MRSRYTAYALGEIDHILNSLHPEHREDVDRKSTEVWSRKAKWLGLEVLATEGGGAEDTKGTVEFRATFEMNGLRQEHHERGEFEKHKGRWYYVDGKQVSQAPVVRDAPRIGRNDPCSCGSGKKYKKCCGAAA
jgi:SEC-C motif-containing protein